VKYRKVVEYGGVGARYRAMIHECRSFWRKQPRWKFKIEREFVLWDYCHTSRKYKTRDEAVAAANAWLDSISMRPHERSDCDGFVLDQAEPTTPTGGDE
jgi:hypothetical protein